jgi:glycine cleavage system H lipoate-binding protein
MSKGTVSDVVEEVKRVIRTLSPGGGHLLSSNHTIQATPRAVENTIAFYWATHMYRSYPIRVETGAKEARTTRVV